MTKTCQVIYPLGLICQILTDRGIKKCKSLCISFSRWKKPRLASCHISCPAAAQYVCLVLFTQILIEFGEILKLFCRHVVKSSFPLSCTIVANKTEFVKRKIIGKETRYSKENQHWTLFVTSLILKLLKTIPLKGRQYC